MRPAVNRRAFLATTAAASVAIAGLTVALPLVSAATTTTAATRHESSRRPGGSPAIHVRLMPLLAGQTVAKQEWLNVAFRPGITPGQIAGDLGFRGATLYSIMAMVNGVQADFITPLAGGDQVELMLGMAGG